ncbi:MAG: hypothetical protein HND52_14305 [Ignavibacteriae bacterium]|nr:hypothetical protein [Ignavibacteriota bacterium]NOG99125.1 hypothetical protein [Ignavibacteriota bacterium]
MAKRKQLIKALLLLFLLIVLVTCANQIAPSGGDPDLTPPIVIEIYPKASTTNFDDNYFEITFSEYVDKRSVKESIFISPEIESQIEYDWSGTTVEVSFEDSLKPNTTYSITVGTDVADINNRNKMSEAFNFAFSTGPEIDEGRISGQVYDANPDGVIMCAYKIDAEEYNPVENKPAYRSQVGSNGKFSFLALAPGTYRVAALRDEFRDYLYNIEEDAYGTLYKDVILSKENPIVQNMNFKLTRQDTTPPDILAVTMTDDYHFLVEFSEYIDSTRLSKNNFYLFDSTESRLINFEQLFKGLAKPKSLFLTFNDSLNEDSENYLIAKNIFDNFSNQLEYQSTSVAVNSEPDTLRPEISGLKTDYPDNRLGIVNPAFTLNFNDGINNVLALTALALFDSRNRKLNLEFDFIDDASLKVIVKNKIESRSEFDLKIDLTKIVDIAGNRGDSTETIKVYSINELDFTGVSGSVLADQNYDNLKVVLESVGTGSKVYNADVDSVNNFKINRVVPGKYLIWSYDDKDSSGSYSYGNIFPFEESEKFAYYPDTLNLRARWPVGDVFINFD